MSLLYYWNLVTLASVVLWTSHSLGAQVKFAIDLTWELGSPDGQSRYLIYTNGQFPGPRLSLNQGDSVEVSDVRRMPLSQLTFVQFTVNNHLPFATAVHFHGIEYGSCLREPNRSLCADIV